MKRFAALIAGLALAFVAPAFAFTATDAVSWTLPTTDVSGTPLAGTPNVLTGIKVYRSLAPLSDPVTIAPVTSLAASATSYTDTFTLSNGDTVYYYVVASNASGDSVLSAPASYTVNIPAAKPGAPVSVTLTVTLH